MAQASQETRIDLEPATQVLPSPLFSGQCGSGGRMNAPARTPLKAWAIHQGRACQLPACPSLALARLHRPALQDPVLASELCCSSGKQQEPAELCHMSHSCPSLHGEFLQKTRAILSEPRLGPLLSATRSLEQQTAELKSLCA